MNIFWFRRDLRLHDNTALQHALNSGQGTKLIFIFDTLILDQLEKDDARVSFIYDCLKRLDKSLKTFDSGIEIYQGTPLSIFKKLIKEHPFSSLYFNKDYEPATLKRDNEIEELCTKHNISVHSFKDQVIFEPGEVLKADGNPYTVFTPFKKKWLQRLETEGLTLTQNSKFESQAFCKVTTEFPSRTDLSLYESQIKVPNYDLSVVESYEKNRDFPDRPGTSFLGPHLRFGTVSIRELVEKNRQSPTFLSELIWREFFMQILFYFPHVIQGNFRSKYDSISWRNNEEEFNKWCEGKTGYPMVDAGMRQLNATGFMHNRVRMITAGFLCKHLLIDWRWGEAYFASKLLDFELASNNGNWQWASGTGCDAAPYFRVFNPTTQFKKFDPMASYVKKWVPEYGSATYPKPIVDHKLARERAIKTYKKGVFDVK